MLIATAQITTDNPQRLITRLCKHWGHKFPVSFDEQRGEIQLGLGPCVLEAHKSSLHVRVQAADNEQLLRLHTIVSEHLQRMAAAPLPEFIWDQQAS